MFTFYNVKSNSILNSVDVLYRSGIEEIKFGFTFFSSYCVKI